MKSFEIFSGAGGLAKGLELAGFTHTGFVEFNKDACESLYENFDKNIVYFGDIKNFNYSDLPEVDIVAGGPPCQPFSLGGKHKADNDHRDMFPYAIKAIEKLQPKAFIFENVKGLLRTSFKDYFEYIILRLTYPSFHYETENWIEHLWQLKKINFSKYKNIKYNITFKLLNAADYGVPQTRERVVIVGIRSDINTHFVFPKPTHSEDSLIWDKYIKQTYWKRNNITNMNKSTIEKSIINKITNVQNRYGLWEPELLPWLTIREALKNEPDPRDEHNITNHIFRDGAKIYSGHTGSDIDWPSKTIKAGGHGVPGGENMLRYNDGTVRYFTVYEAKILQTFPKNYIIKGSWGEALRQIGNAVPVLLAQIIGEALRERLTHAYEYSVSNYEIVPYSVRV